MGVIVAIHLIAAVIWVGGMFFAVYVLRLAAGPMEPKDRINLWRLTFQKFFPWVWLAVTILPLSGYWIIFSEEFGGFASLPILYHIMHGLGWIMIALFLHLWFAPYSRFRRAVDAEDFPTAGKHLNSIRLIVTTNLWIGLVNVFLGVLGRF